MKLAFKLHPGKHNKNGITISLSHTLYESEVQHSTHHQMMGAYDCNDEKKLSLCIGNFAVTLDSIMPCNV